MQQTEVVYDLGVFKQRFKMLKEDTHQVQVEVAYLFSNAHNKLNQNLNRKLVTVDLINEYF